MSSPGRPEDILEQHDTTPGPAGVWLRRVLVGIGIVAAVAAAVRAQLESQEPAQPVHTRQGSAAAPDVFTPAVVARQGSSLLRYAPSGASTIVELPEGFGPDERLWSVDDAGASPVLYGVSERQLFRVDIRRGRLVGQLGRVERIVGPGPGIGELVVQVPHGRRSRAVVVEAATADVVDSEIFASFDGGGGWTPRGVVTVYGVPGLVLTRPDRSGRDEAAIAWSSRGDVSGVAAGQVQRFGTPGRLLGVTRDWVLFLAGRCPSASCTLRVLSFTRDTWAMRPVLPPDGWMFGLGPVAGQAHDVLVPVVARADRSEHALARLVPAGTQALLLLVSEGFEPSAGVVERSDGSVFFLVGDGERSRRVVVWSPGEVPPPPASGRGLRLPATARLSCVCG